jgi:hypothetical protein
VRLASLVNSDQLSEVQHLILATHKVRNAAEKFVNGIVFCGSRLYGGFDEFKFTGP